MKFEIAREDDFDTLRFSGELSMHEVAKLDLDRLDRALLTDVGDDRLSTAADYLLALEMIFRRHAEQTDQEPKHA